MAKLNYKIKSEYNDALITLGGCNVVLGKREDIEVVIDYALNFDRSYCSFFSVLPTKEEFDAWKDAKDNTDTTAIATPVSATATKKDTTSDTA